MIASVILPVIRRAILDLLDAIGGEHNDDTLTIQLVALGHRVARRDVAGELLWLGCQGLVKTEMLGPYVVVEILPDGCDVAAGRLRIEGVSKHKTGV